MIKKVMLLEDDQFLSNIYKRLAQFYDVELELAPDGDDFVEKVKRYQPDIIALDMLMPRKNGIDVLRELKADEKTKPIPVVMLTNVDNLDLKRQAIAEGAADYWIKSADDLDKIFKRLIKRK